MAKLRKIANKKTMTISVISGSWNFIIGYIHSFTINTHVGTTTDDSKQERQQSTIRLHESD
jgi:hypothetical protein